MVHVSAALSLYTFIKDMIYCFYYSIPYSSTVKKETSDDEAPTTKTNLKNCSILELSVYMCSKLWCLLCSIKLA